MDSQMRAALATNCKFKVYVRVLACSFNNFLSFPCEYCEVIILYTLPGLGGAVTTALICLIFFCVSSFVCRWF